MKIIVGLGNPGEKYKLTRHNAGFIVLDELARELELSWEWSKKLNADIAKKEDMLLVKPRCYMNISGQVVEAVLSYYKALPKKLKLFTKKGSDLSAMLTVVHDDLDVLLGKYKIATDSRSAGHNGVQSIINYLKTQNFRRFRIGIKNEQLKMIQKEAGPKKASAVGKFVLHRFANEELDVINLLAKDIAKELA